MEQFGLHTSPDKNDRLKACPIIFFKRIKYHGRTKGNVQFQGFGLIQRAERITQFDIKTGTPFTNYVFEFIVMDLLNENESFNWDWITARRNQNNDDNYCLEFAPQSWKKWVVEGYKVLESCRRRIVKILTVTTREQIPEKKSREEKALKDIFPSILTVIKKIVLNHWHLMLLAASLKIVDLIIEKAG